MFTTIEAVKELTNYDVTVEQIIMAQTIIESYVGRVEVNVTSPDDLMLLGRATAYQTAYISENADTVFQQVPLASIVQFGQSIQFKSGNETSPFISGLAVIACKHLSWRGTRSVKTGSIFGSPLTKPVWERD